MSRSIVHLLLSLVLLVTQQMALAHGLSHVDQLRKLVSAQQSAGVVDDGSANRRQGDPDSAALHAFCVECAADAQLDLALPLPDHAFQLPRSLAPICPAPCADGVRPRAVHLFQPRGPPQAN